MDVARRSVFSRGLRLACMVVTTTCVVEASGAEWGPGPSLAVARNAPAVCVGPCGTIYVIGGTLSGGGHTATCEMLEFSKGSYANAWTTLPSLNTPRGSAAAACHDGYLYAIGGSPGPLVDVERLDLRAANPAWESSAVPDLPVALGAASAAVDDWGRIWVIGAIPGNVGVVRIYDPARPERGWQSGPDLLVPRSPCCPVPCATDRLGRIYALGGDGGAGHLADVERIDPCDASPGWELVDELLPALTNGSPGAMGLDGRIYIAGGWLGFGTTNRVDRYDPDSDEWEHWVDLNQARTNSGVVLGRDDRIYVIGGESAPFNSLDSVEVATPPCGAGLAKLPLMDHDADSDIGIVDFLALLARWGCP